MANPFNKPVSRTIADIPVQILQIPFAHFEQAIVIGEWFHAMEAGQRDFAELRNSLQPGSPRREALLELLKVCVQIEINMDGVPTGSYRQISTEELDGMPIIVMAEAVIQVMEVNADFFFQQMPRLAKTAAQIMSIGTQLSSSSSGQDTTSTPSVATA